DGEVDFDAEAGRDLADADVAGDGQVWRQRDLGLPGHEFQGAQEAGRVTGREQLLRIGSRTTAAAEFRRCAQFQVKDAIGTFRGTFTATLRGGLGAVEDFFDAHANSFHG